MGQTIKKKEVCQCKNCGNEAEMVFTCSLPDAEEDSETSSRASEPSVDSRQKKQARGTATCTHCGNEADMWIDY
jgi:DNA-directed RNA polymerase subunit M/transcription elongation factor TFIIS